MTTAGMSSCAVDRWNSLLARASLALCAGEGVEQIYLHRSLDGNVLCEALNLMFSSFHRDLLGHRFYTVSHLNLQVFLFYLAEN